MRTEKEIKRNIEELRKEIAMIEELFGKTAAAHYQGRIRSLLWVLETSKASV